MNTDIPLDEVFPERWELRPAEQTGLFEFVEPLWPHEVEDLFDEAFEASEEGSYEEAEEIYLEALEHAPDHLEGWLLLADLYFETDQQEKRIQTTSKAMQRLQALLPANFEAARYPFSWEHDGSAILLRVFYTHACALADEGEHKKAQELFEDLLRMDAEDEQGARYLLPRIYLECGVPTQLLTLRNRYPEDQAAEILWNIPLAFLLLQEPDMATVAIRDALVKSPKVAQELLRATHKPPKSLPIDGIEVGSEHEAYAYFLDMGDLWKSTAGAMELLRSLAK